MAADLKLFVNTKKLTAKRETNYGDGNSTDDAQWGEVKIRAAENGGYVLMIDYDGMAPMQVYTFPGKDELIQLLSVALK